MSARHGEVAGEQGPAPTADIATLLLVDDEPENLRVAISMLSEHELDELARVVGTNRTTLNRLFQTHLGTSVMGYLREQRLQRARALLTTSTWSLEQISTAVGYQNPGALSRALHARFGTTPTELRKRAAGA
jgi:transcriptional regulator GlxA family with amidase domain